MQASASYGSDASNTSGLGFAFNNALMANLSMEGRIFEFHWGVQELWSSAQAGPDNLGYLAVYPELRIQMSRLFIGAGATPLAWRRSSPESGYDGFASSKSTLSMLGEAGILWPVVHDFSLGATLSGQWVTQSGTSSPAPLLNATILMRFYITFWGKSSGGSGNSNEFKGWRYPFGMIR